MEGGGTARKVMVVADPTRESADALQFALSHVVVENDTLILLHVDNRNAWRGPFGSFFKRPNGGGCGPASGPSFEEVDFLETMKQSSVAAQPKVKVAAVKADGKDKAAAILANSEAREVDLLVVGHRWSLSNAILGSRRGGSRGGLDIAENLILNSKCTCVAVQKKGQNAGFLLNSKTHKNFWILA